MNLMLSFQCLHKHQWTGFFRKNFDGGTQNFWSSLVTDGDEVGWGGGNLWKKSDWSQNCPLMQNYIIFCYSKHEIQLFKVLLSLRVVKFDTKNVSRFFKYFETNLGWGASLGPKTGTCVGWGVDKIFAWWGGRPPSPPGKKTPGEESNHVMKLM